MKSRHIYSILLAGLMAAGLVGPLPVLADDEDDHEEAWRAVKARQALPLAEILREVNGRLGGDIIEVELEREDGRYVYEFKVITSAGQLLEIYVDALSAEILEIDD
ncbi:MAG: PepSY domain-containing protein [Wenzhouxiangella sp.]|jgi:uncharacterized membrane protein YkoI|nr:PepSY domain-containing protein [Wenzhouxiangella sp.]